MWGVMSDYFRYYCDGLDEPRLLYAMNKCNLVHTVWMWVLSECARTKRNQIEHPSNAMLVGLGYKLNIPVGSLQLSLNLLVEIEYISDAGGLYIVRNWNKLQSKYMQEKEWRDAHKNQKKPKETKNPIGEERRGERERDAGTPDDLRGQVIAIQSARTWALSAIDLENALKGVSDKAKRRAAVEKFVADCANMHDAPGNPLGMLRSYLAREANPQPAYRGGRTTIPEKKVETSEERTARISRGCL
jgi:hypothetical protein